MKFVIRDDDLNYFSTPEDIQKWYQDVFNIGIPVGFSAIPFINPAGDAFSSDVPVTNMEHPIRENELLTEYVGSQALIEVLQHGTTHETRAGVYEYQDSRLSVREALRGKQELERAFGRPVTVFVPPHDWIGTAGILAVEAANLNVIRGRGAGLRNMLPRFAYLRVFLHMLLFKLSFTVFGKRVPAYPYVLDFGKHKEVCSYRLEDTDVFEGLDYAHKKDGIFVVVTHLHFYTEEKKERLLQIIARARELDAEFVTPSSLFV